MHGGIVRGLGIKRLDNDFCRGIIVAGKKFVDLTCRRLYHFFACCHCLDSVGGEEIIEFVVKSRQILHYGGERSGVGEREVFELFQSRAQIAFQRLREALNGVQIRLTFLRKELVFHLRMQDVRRLFVVEAEQDIIVDESLNAHVLNAVHRAYAVGESGEIFAAVGDALSLARHGDGHRGEHIGIGFDDHGFLQICRVWQRRAVYAPLDLFRGDVHVRTRVELQADHGHVVIRHRGDRSDRGHAAQRLFEHRRDFFFHYLGGLTRVDGGDDHIGKIHIGQKIHVRIENGNDAQNDYYYHHDRDNVRSFYAESR